MATCPFLCLFNYTRFDITPSALLLLAIYFFLPSPSKENLSSVRILQPWQALIAGLLIAAGVLVKWLPAVSAPWLIRANFQAKKWRDLTFFAVSSLVLSVLVLIPSYLSNPAAFWYPYKFQGERKLIGESFWYLLQYFWLAPAQIIASRPWDEPNVVKLDNTVLCFLQILLTGLVIYNLK